MLLWDGGENPVASMNLIHPVGGQRPRQWSPARAVEDIGLQVFLFNHPFLFAYVFVFTNCIRQKLYVLATTVGVSSSASCGGQVRPPTGYDNPTVPVQLPMISLHADPDSDDQFGMKRPQQLCDLY